MSNVKLVSKQTQAFSGSIEEILRQGSRTLIQQAIEAELQILLAQHSDLRTPEGKSALVRNGYLPERNIMTAVGEVTVKVPKVRDRTGSGIKFNSSIVPPFLRRSKVMNEFIPWLYLRGISTGDMGNTLTALLGKDIAIGTELVNRLKSQWETEYLTWVKEDLSKKRFVYIWADGIYSQVRMDDRLCLLVIIGVDEFGYKHLLAVHDGTRESEQSWTEVLTDLEHRGLTAPHLAIGDGAMGFWKALSKIYPTTQSQRCWFHKMGNVLNKLPKAKQSHAKMMLQQIWQADTQNNAIAAYEKFIATYRAKYPDAVKCLEKDKDNMFSFFDYPALHWQHIRTSNPIESTFATVRLRSTRSKNCGSRLTTFTMVFKLAQCAQQKWRKLKGFSHLAEIISGVKFKDGVKIVDESAA